MPTATKSRPTPTTTQTAQYRYLVRGKRVVVVVPVQMVIGGQQARQRVTVERGRLLPNGVDPAVIESLLDNDLIDVYDGADVYAVLFGYDAPVGDGADDEYDELFRQPYASAAEDDDLGEFSRLLPPRRTPQERVVSDAELLEAIGSAESALWRLRWARRTR